MEERRAAGFACQRCKRLKVRCTTEEGQNDCVRCQRANQPCVAAAPMQGGSNRGGSSSGGGNGGIRKDNNRHRFASIERISLATKAALSPEENEEKYNQLANVVTQAQQEMSRLKPGSAVSAPKMDFNKEVRLLKKDEQNGLGGLSMDLFNIPPAAGAGAAPTATSSAAGGEELDTDWSPQVLRKPNPCQTLVELNIMSQSDMDFYYRFFLSKLSPYVPVGYDETANMDHNVAREPIATLAMVVSAKIVSSLEKSKAANMFLARVVNERIMVQNECTLDLMKAVLIMLAFIHPIKEPKFSLMFLLGSVLGDTLSLGRNEDCQTLLGGNSGAKTAFDRTRMWMMVHLTMSNMSLHTNRTNLYKTMPSFQLAMDALRGSSMVTVKEEWYLLTLQTVNAAREAFLSINQPLTASHSHQQVEALVKGFATAADEYLERGRDLLKTADSKDAVAFRVLEMCNTNCSLMIHESALCQLVFGCHSPPTSQIVMQKIKQVTDKCEASLDQFLQLAQRSGPLFPRFFYYYPLFTLCAMVRVRLMVWSYGLDIKVEVESWYQQVYDQWLKLSQQSLVAEETFGMLRKVEKWKNLQVYDGGQTMNETTQLLQKLLKEVMMLVQEGQPTTTGTDASNVLTAPPNLDEITDEAIDPALSTVDYEGMLKELFGDFYKI